MKTKSYATKAAATALTLMVAAWAMGLGWGVAAVSAAEDTPAQTAARSALRQKMQQADAITNETASASPAVSAVSPTLKMPPKMRPDETDTWAAAIAPVTTTVRLSPVISRAAISSLAPERDSGLSQHTQGKLIEKFHAENLDLKTALALFASQNDLNIVPDNDISGMVTLELHNLPLEQMMRALLEAGDCSWQEDQGLIRVRNTETRTFAVDYLRLKRTGLGNSSATLNSATSGGSGGGGSGGGSGGGGGSSSSSSVNLTADNATDFWTELRAELGSILTETGLKSLAINKTAGIIEVTDRPSVLKKMEHYLNATAQSINRQVDIETKIYDVNLNDAFQFGIDWNHVAAAYEGSLGFGTATLPVAIGSGSALGNSSLGGLNTSPSHGIMSAANTLVFSNMNTSAAITALKTQGNVQVVAAPRIRTLNNQTAVIKVGQELPFFASTTINSQSSSGNQVTSGDAVTTVTVGTILSITPQISEDGWISMDISPVLTSLVQIDRSPSGSATAPVLDTKQASTLARVRNGTTVVLGGLIQTEKASSASKVPLLGDIPLLGQLFTGTYHSKTKSELVIFVTPHIVEAGETSVEYQNPPVEAKPPKHHFF